MAERGGGDRGGRRQLRCRTVRRRSHADAATCRGSSRSRLPQRRAMTCGAQSPPKPAPPAPAPPQPARDATRRSERPGGTGELLVLRPLAAPQNSSVRLVVAVVNRGADPWDMAAREVARDFTAAVLGGLTWPVVVALAAANQSLTDARARTRREQKTSHSRKVAPDLLRLSARIRPAAARSDGADRGFCVTQGQLSLRKECGQGW